MSAQLLPAAALALDAADLQLVKAILRKHIPKHRVWAFGSRALRDANDAVKPHADLDLLLDGQTLDVPQRADLREAFTESELPMRVDLVNIADLPAGWKIRAWHL